MSRGLAGVLAAAVLLATAAGATTVAGAAAPPRVDLTPYRGLGTWVDLYDPPVFRHPLDSVRAMAARGVKTLYLETSNYRSRADVMRPAILGRMVDAAHARGMRVVAWYLPSFANPARDLRRSLAAIRFRTATGGRFDSFALDIEASVVKPVWRRNGRLLGLSASIRAAVGRTYALGAIIPSPSGIQRLGRKYWPGFPYRDLALFYDVFLPMSYFSYRTGSAAAARAYIRNDIVAIRRATGRPAEPVHAIGGVASSLTLAKVRGFIRAARDCGTTGASLYDFVTTSGAQWRALAALAAQPAPPEGAPC